MLTALETGVKGGVWFSLIDKVFALRTLRVAWTQVKANAGAAGVDHVTVAMYERDLDDNLERLSRALRDGTYRPQPVRRAWIDKPGSREQRPLGIPTVRDRIVQTALRLVLEPIFEREFAAHSYGFRPERGCKEALRRVQELLDAGSTWVVDADLRRCFDTIPHAALMARVRTKVADGRVLALLEAFLAQAVMEGLSAWTPDEGTPQGAVMTPCAQKVTSAVSVIFRAIRLSRAAPIRRSGWNGNTVADDNGVTVDEYLFDDQTNNALPFEMVECISGHSQSPQKRREGLCEAQIG
jgi:RNA-directed DNA polymerase